ncbi:glycosyltransferase involved in cell wall biosynthesis [Cryobacterium sp. MP_3.1]|uniref:glycosyltransferase n=1 Tax=Cryobacterium sp. MP_3.1 TaxID=3071711 RepID=UPI002DFEE7AB|nr:glycosyltransferase involved in cell wall biosynthesis [Cryobacterium sp. MP_3.1]
MTLRVLVYPHDLGIGGSQLNAIEIAAALQRRGHRVIVFGTPGALVQRIADLGLEFVAAPRPGRRPSPRVARALADLVVERKIDVLHGYEWPPALECILASRLQPSAVAVSTVMSMAVAPFLPKSLPLAVGTEAIAAAERAFGRSSVSLLEPPVDLTENHPGAVPAGVFGAGDDGLFTVGMVTRFAHQLKLEGILTAIDTVGALARHTAIRLVIAGDGPAREEVAARAAHVNANSGAGTVVLLGEVTDPRPVYESADVMLGMGGSALKALAFAKPLVVQGEGGYWELLTPDTLPEFLWAGWYGVGESAETGPARLEGILRQLLEDAGLRAEVGAFGLATVHGRFSVEAAAVTQLAIYRAALQLRVTRGQQVRHDAAALTRYARYYAGKRVRRLIGIEQTDDFNARPARVRPGSLPVTTGAGS